VRLLVWAKNMLSLADEQIERAEREAEEEQARRGPWAGRGGGKSSRKNTRDASNGQASVTAIVADNVPTGGLLKPRATTVVSRGCAASAASGKARLICDPRHCAHVNNLLTDEAGWTCPIAYDH